MEEAFPPDEEYDRQCGDIFLTVKGDLVIHCTLCVKRFKGFEKYKKHVSDRHYSESQLEDLEKFEEFEEVFTQADTNNEFDPIEEPTTTNNEDLLESESNDTLDCTKENASSDYQRAYEPKTTKSSAIIQSLHGNMTRTRTCPVCGFSCSDMSNFSAHLRRHSDIKNHKCTKCPKTFYTRYEQQIHIRTHTGERPFKCSECGRAFTTSSRLNLHIKRHRNGPTEKCKKCDALFSDDDEFNQHVCGPFICRICKGYFKSQKALNSHMSVHKHKTDYPCSLCHFTFKLKSKLNEHLHNFHSKVAREKIKLNGSLGTD